MQNVIDEMKSLNLVTMGGRREPTYTEQIAFQKEIVKAFGMENILDI